LQARVTRSNTDHTNVWLYDAQIAPGYWLDLGNQSDVRNIITHFETQIADDPSFRQSSRVVPAVGGDRYVAAFKETNEGQQPSRYFYQCEFDSFWGLCK